MKEKLIELMKEKGFYNRNEGIIELEECDVVDMAEAIIKLYNLHIVSNNEVAVCEDCKCQNKTNGKYDPYWCKKYRDDEQTDS